MYPVLSTQMDFFVTLVKRMAVRKTVAVWCVISRFSNLVAVLSPSEMWVRSSQQADTEILISV